MASIAAAAIALHAGQPTIAAERALAAAAALESVAALWDAARARALAGRAFARAGERDRAVLELERAAAAFESFGSLRYRDQAERELRRLGRHFHHRTHAGTKDGSGLAALTERELQIARLVTDRKTNAQIAAELFLSHKTVETHLRNIFNKVGVETRVDLARAVERAARTPLTSRDSPGDSSPHRPAHRGAPGATLLASTEPSLMRTPRRIASRLRARLSAKRQAGPCRWIGEVRSTTWRQRALEERDRQPLAGVPGMGEPDLARRDTALIQYTAGSRPPEPTASTNAPGRR